MIAFIIVFCGLGAATITLLTMNFAGMEMPVAILTSFIPLFLGGGALAARDTEKEEISLKKRIIGVLVIIGILAIAAKPYYELWFSEEIASALWKKVLLVWFGFVSLFLVWVTSKK